MARVFRWVCAALIVLAALTLVIVFLTRESSSERLSREVTELERVLREEGARAALEYLQNVAPRAGYGDAHFYYHLTGEYVYAETGSLEEAFLTILPYVASPDVSFQATGLDGLYHGILISYFRAAGEGYAALGTGVCEGQLVAPGLTDDSFTCYHAVGHAIMAAEGNTLLPALTTCEELPKGEPRGGCYYGAYMEAARLYLPEYHPSDPRPDVEGVSLVTVCDRLSNSERDSFCWHFVGDSYLANARDDVRGAFKECLKSEGYSATCAKRIGMLLAMTVLDTEHEANSYCANHAGALQESCVDGALYGLSEGFSAR